MTNYQNKAFTTDNFQLAAFLLAESCKLIGTNKTNPQRVVFLFEESEQRKQRTDLFLSYQAKVEPHRFFSAQKDLKQILYSES